VIVGDRPIRADEQLDYIPIVPAHLKQHADKLVASEQQHSGGESSDDGGSVERQSANGDEYKPTDGTSAGSHEIRAPLKLSIKLNKQKRFGARF
jgi:hypothetical protein